MTLLFYRARASHSPIKKSRNSCGLTQPHITLIVPPYGGKAVLNHIDTGCQDHEASTICIGQRNRTPRLVSLPRIARSSPTFLHAPSHRPEAILLPCLSPSEEIELNTSKLHPSIRARSSKQVLLRQALRLEGTNLQTLRLTAQASETLRCTTLSFLTILTERHIRSTRRHRTRLQDFALRVLIRLRGQSDRVVSLHHQIRILPKDELADRRHGPLPRIRTFVISNRI